MTKQEYMAMSLPYGLKLMQSCKYWATPEADRVVLFTGLSEIDNKMPEQYQNIPCEPTVFYRVNENTTGTDSVSKFKPICRPLSDLTKPIEHKGEKFIPIVELLKNSSFDTSKMSEGEIMSFVKVYSNTDLIALNDLPLYLQWHFDLFGGIDSGEAIDVNTLDINPYK